MISKLKLIFFTVVILVLGFTSISYPQLPKETHEQKKERMAWWTHDRFGMFIHWGLYAIGLTIHFPLVNMARVGKTGIRKTCLKWSVNSNPV